MIGRSRSRWRSGDAVTESEYLPYVRACLSPYRRSIRPSDLDDVIAEGCLGLVYALRRYEPAHGVKVQTYAQHWVRGRVLDARRRIARTARDLPLVPHVVDRMRYAQPMAERMLLCREAVADRHAARRAMRERPCPICGGVVRRKPKHSDTQWAATETCGQSCGATLRWARRREAMIPSPSTVHGG
jgi:hypothetical protein